MISSSHTVLVGGVGQLFQIDQDVGRLVVERYAEHAPEHAIVEDLSYGAIAVSHRVLELDPRSLVLVGSSERGDPPGTVRRRRVTGVDRSPEELQGSVADAGTGYVDLELTVDVLHAFERLPARTVVIEIEPGEIGPGDALTPEVEAAIGPAIDRIDDEVAVSPALELMDLLRERVEDGAFEPSPIADALRGTLDGLRTLDLEGRWGATFSQATRLRLAISEHGTSQGMEHRDWAMMWGLLEELERLQARSAGSPAGT